MPVDDDDVVERSASDRVDVILGKRLEREMAVGWQRRPDLTAERLVVLDALDLPRDAAPEHRGSAAPVLEDAHVGQIELLQELDRRVGDPRKRGSARVD